MAFLMSNENNLNGLGRKLAEGFYILHGFEDSPIVEEGIDPDTRAVIGSVFKPELHYSQDDPFEMYREDH